MLADKCHVTIGGYHYQVDESIDHSANPEGGSLFRPHYRHWYQQLMGDRAAIIVGAPNTKDLRPERLVWSYNDWVGGEGNRTFQPQDPYVYDYSFGVNPRIRGQITGRPNRTLTAATSDDQRVRGAFAMANNALWMGQSKTIQYSTTGTTWTTQTSNCSTTVTGTAITAVAGDGEYFYYADWASASSGTRVLHAATTAAAGTDVVASATGKAPYAGLATANGRLYAWTGRKLIEHDVFQSFVLNANYIRKVGDSGVDPISTNVFGTSWWANCVAAETSVFCFYTTDGQSTVFEFQLDGGFAPVWICPYGLSIKAMQYTNGVLYMSGHWGGDTNNNGRGVLYAMPLDTRRPVFVNWVRKQNNMNLQMQEMAASYGSQIMLAAARTGRVFIYDADMDGLSCLDDIATVVNDNSGGLEVAAPRITDTDALAFTENSSRIADMVTYGTKRIVQTFNPSATVAGTTISILAYDDDEPINRQGSTATGDAITNLEVGDYDFDMPFDQKVLLGFDVMFKPLTTGQSFQLSYSLDGASYVTTTAVTSVSADAAKGRTYVTVSSNSSTVKFGRMRWKITLTGARTGGVNYLPPIIYNVTSECMLMTYDEMWDLVLRFKDEKPGTRMSTHKVKGSTLRDFLFTSANAKTVLAFVDGYVYSDPGHTKSSVDVVIDSIEDIAIRNGEGSCKIRLRKVPN